MFKKIIIREIKKEDSDFLYTLYSKRKSYDIITPIKKKDHLLFVLNYLSHKESHPFKKWCIIEFESKNIGSLTLNKNNNELGFWIMSDFQGRGIGSYAIKRFMKMNGEKTYTLKSHKNNSRSKHMAEKLGFNFSHYFYTYNKK